MKLLLFIGLLSCGTSFAESWKPYYDAAITAKSEKYQSDTSPVSAVYANWLDVSSTPSVGVLVKKSGENKLELLATCSPDMNTKCLATIEVSASGLLVRDLAENSQVTSQIKLKEILSGFRKSI